jgi:hypothetical protein
MGHHDDDDHLQRRQQQIDIAGLSFDINHLAEQNHDANQHAEWLNWQTLYIVCASFFHFTLIAPLFLSSYPSLPFLFLRRFTASETTMDT